MSSAEPEKDIYTLHVCTLCEENEKRQKTKKKKDFLIYTREVEVESKSETTYLEQDSGSAGSGEDKVQATDRDLGPRHPDPQTLAPGIVPRQHYHQDNIQASKREKENKRMT